VAVLNQHWMQKRQLVATTCPQLITDRHSCRETRWSFELSVGCKFECWSFAQFPPGAFVVPAFSVLFGCFKKMTNNNKLEQLWTTQICLLPSLPFSSMRNAPSCNMVSFELSLFSAELLFHLSLGLGMTGNQMSSSPTVKKVAQKRNTVKPR